MMRFIGTKITLKRLQNKGKRSKRRNQSLKDTVLHSMKRYLRWTIKVGGGIMQLWQPDGSFILAVIGHRDDLAKID